VESVLGHYRFNQLSGETLSQFPRKQKLLYKLDQHTLEKFKASYFGKRYESVIFNKMWRIRWFPNGANAECASFMSIYLVLCRIPYKIKTLTTKYRIICKELNRSISAVDDFSFAASNWGKSKFIGLADIEPLTTLTFIIDLEILKETASERRDDEIWAESQIAYTLSLHDDMERDAEGHRLCHPLTVHPTNSEAPFLEKRSSAHSASSPRSSKSQGGSSRDLVAALKKEVKSLRKQMAAKEHAIDQMAAKLNEVRAALRTEIETRGAVVHSLSNKMSAMEQATARNDDDEKQHSHSLGAPHEVQIQALSEELQRIKRTVAELQSTVESQNGKNVVSEGTKKEQLRLWLVDQDLSQYLGQLTDNGFEDVLSLRDLTKDVMEQIGIEKIGHQLKLLRLIRKMDCSNGQRTRHGMGLHQNHQNHHHAPPEYSHSPQPPQQQHQPLPEPPQLGGGGGGSGYGHSFHGNQPEEEMYNGTGSVSVAASVTYHEGPYSGPYAQ